MPNPVRDNESPASLGLEIKTTDGQLWGTIVAGAKEFRTGSVGFYGNGKIINPQGGKPYQVGANITLIGSKPQF